ncbi:hypothetical protein EON80_03515 [bacterium]|nr:MAG: hypothetical protein EON80_03515 [bacterium]
MNILRIIDELEQLVEKSSGFMGKRMVNEEEFFTQIQRLRATIPQSLKDAEDLLRSGMPTSVNLNPSKSVREVITESSALSRKEQLQIICALAAHLEASEDNVNVPS